MGYMPPRWSISLHPTMRPLQWSILAEDLGVVIAVIAGAREVTLVGAGTAEIQPGLDAGRDRSAV